MSVEIIRTDEEIDALLQEEHITWAGSKEKFTYKRAYLSLMIWLNDMYDGYKENRECELDRGIAKALFCTKDLMRGWLKDCIEE